MPGLKRLRIPDARDPGNSVMPGAVTTPAFAAEFVKGQKNLEVVELPSGVHFHQEDHPHAIGSSVGDWINRAERVKLKIAPNMLVER